MAFTFNRKYGDKEQVREWLPAFSAIREDMAARGQYPYNDAFKGLIPGIAGPSEDTAIYLLQTLCRLEDERREVVALEADLTPLTTLPAQARFARVVLYRDREHYYSGDTGKIETYDDARIVPDEAGRPLAVLPKGKRTHGIAIQTARVLVKA